MDFKLTIKCQKCRCAFELRPRKFKTRDAMCCPNCGEQMPDDVFQHIKDGIENLGAVPVVDQISVKNPPFDVSLAAFSDAHDLAVSD